MNTQVAEVTVRHTRYDRARNAPGTPRCVGEPYFRLGEHGFLPLPYRAEACADGLDAAQEPSEVSERRILADGGRRVANAHMEVGSYDRFPRRFVEDIRSQQLLELISDSSHLYLHLLPRFPVHRERDTLAFALRERRRLAMCAARMFE